MGAGDLKVNLLCDGFLSFEVVRNLFARAIELLCVFVWWDLWCFENCR